MDDISRKHHVIEAMRRAYRDRAVFLGDPDYYKVPVRRLLDKNYLHGLAITIDPDKATPSAELGNTPGLLQTGSDTTHFSVIDKAGNRVAATLSINLPFGSCFVAPGTGVLLNDEMDDFSIKPHTPNAYGLVGDKANAIEGGKRPLSSMTPTFVETEDRIGILGTPGGSRIISMVLLGVLDFADGHKPESWVSLPRYHHQYLPDEVQFEKNGMSIREQLSLKKRGHTLNEKSRRYGNMQAILWDKKENKVYAASDPRGEGEARVAE
jgi:gamma-glutamyltranspeptidase/glutathione hydrolase